MKMRRESLGQILLLRKGILTPSKHKMILRERKDLSSPGNSPIVFSPRSKKRPIPLDFEENTPSKKSVKLDESESTTPKVRKIEQETIQKTQNCFENGPKEAVKWANLI